MQIDTRNADYNRLMDAARERAAALRKQAVRDAWSGAEGMLAHALRSARRFARSMARHAHLRSHGMEG